MHLHEMLKQEIATVEKDWLQAKKLRTEAENREVSLRGKLNALRGAYDALAPVPETKVNTEALTTPATMDAISINGNGHQKNTTDFIRDLIRTHPNDGISAVDIWKAIQKAGIDVGRNYIYAVLARSAEKNLIVQKEHRYYPSGVQ